MINLSILKHPMNWVTVAIWLFAVGIAAVSLKLSPYPKQGS